MGGSSNNLVYLDKNNFTIESNMLVNCDIIKKNIGRYKNVIFPTSVHNTPSNENNITILHMLLINITLNDKCPGYPTADMDESCKLADYIHLNWSRF